MKNHELINTVISHLRKSNFDKVAEDLQNLANNLDSENEDLRKEAIFQIKQRCHIKALGDFPVKTMPMNDWYKLLDDLHDYVDKIKVK
jgi:hypothetical protein